RPDHEYGIRALGGALEARRHVSFSHVPKSCGSQARSQGRGGFREEAEPSDSGAQYAELVPTAGGFQAVECRPGRGEIERLPGQVARAVLRRRRPGKQIPLRITAAELAQLLELLPTLDAFRNHLDVQMPGHGDDGADDGEIAHVRHQVTHETAVDLERIHAPALQVREARVADAEIIDGDAHAELAQARYDVLARLAVA